MLYRIEQEYTPELVVSLIRLYGKNVKVVAKANHEVIYIDTPKNRVIFSSRWNMTPQQLQKFMNDIETLDRRKQYPFHSPSAFAMSFWKKNYGASERNFVPNDGFRFEMMREAVYGGRCEAYRIGGKTLNKYDINSSYPYHASMALFAVPGSLDYVTNGTLSNIRNFQGMSRISYCQNEYAPLLPTRHNGRVYYANGDELSGTYTHSELRYALENGLITNVKVLKQYIADDYDNPLHEFMRDCYDKRAENKIWKMIANSLIGRLCASPDGIIEFKPGMKGDPRPDSSQLVMRVTEKHSPRHIYLYGEKKDIMVKNNPLWAAEVYALARITLHDAMLSSDELWYCDTDCIIASSNKNISIGTELGQWKHTEAPIQVYGAKQYQQGDEIVWKGVAVNSEKRKHISGSLYTQERMLLDDGSTAPYSAREVKAIEVASHVSRLYDKRRKASGTSSNRGASVNPDGVGTDSGNV